jgi:hypothetical protein
MLKRISAITVAGGAAIALLSAATPSFATTATTYTVTPGGAVTGKATKPTLKDTKSGTVLTCTSSATSATLKKGSGLSGSGIGSITKLSFTSCTGPLSFSFTVALSKLPYKLNVTGATSSAGVTKGTITGIAATVSGSGCSMTVGGTTATATGTVDGTYTNSTGVLKVTGGNLHIWNVKGCFGLVATGDPSTFAASYKITPKQTITSS